LVQLAEDVSAQALATTLGWTFLVAGLLPLIHTRARHLSWVVLFASGGLCLGWVGA
jgi:hypothetical protein